MANGFDRLERFFAKRKASAVSTDSADNVLPVNVAASEQQFPSPSFIRPKVSRMAAREEVGMKPRSPLFSESPSSLRVGSVDQNTPRGRGSLVRISSLRNMNSQPFISALHDFEFPRPPTHSGEVSTGSSDGKPSFDLIGQRSPRSLSPHKSHLPPRIDTPPVSDPEDEGVSLSQYFRNKKLPQLPSGAPPTPERSPELSPVKDIRLRETETIDILDQSVYQDLRRQLNNAFPDQNQSPEASGQSSPRVSIGSSTLREPDVNEFLELSDDDIAEDEPSVPILRSSPSPTPSTTSSQSQSLLTLTPPYASRPATAAAFEAARIAKRYNFDLVYVVNLWPDGTRPQSTGLEAEDSASFDSSWSNKTSKQMTGRLLAAYGLQNVKSPFQISAAVHGKILRSDGWIEYQNQTAENDEFVRGYACAFYTGHYSRNNSVTLSSPTSSSQRGKIDRGIVFAAYRKPQVDGETHNISSDPTELESIHQDAEVLVEMLIDIHVANRQRQPLSQQCDETGPMPVQRSPVL